MLLTYDKSIRFQEIRMEHPRWKGSLCDMSELGQPFILVVESDEVDRSVIERGLFSSGQELNVLFAWDGEQAIKVIRQGIEQIPQELPTLVLLSMRLPKVNGEEFLSYLRTQGGAESIPVIVMVNPGNDQERDQAAQLGAIGTIDKSFEFKDFQETLSGIAKFACRERNSLPQLVSLFRRPLLY